MVRGVWRRGFTLIELMIVVAVIGVLATVAIPSFMKYLRRSRTTEALMNLRRLYDSSVGYYVVEHANQAGQIIVRQFPDTQLMTPTPVGVCCPNVGQKCNPSTYAASWQSPTWQALNFSVDDPFYYSYQYDSAGADTTAIFTATASGDLTCDGARFSLFQRIGYIQNNVVSGGAGLYMLNETE